ncbi:MAG: putative Large-conductance mechanosensitive channel-like protein [Candidatus Saccharibacteria bacterium]|nr:putative Large-conductance mechanosensitive channel-like protein [Candidatus Saccharibacteria bacterium]
MATNAELAKEKAKLRAEQLKGRGTKHATGFVEFIRTQGVIGLAIGLAIGTAAGDTVKKLVEGFITPIVQFIVGSRDGLETAVWHTELFGRTADFKWGAFVSSAIALLATALVIYWVIHVLKLDKLDKKKD